MKPLCSPFKTRAKEKNFISSCLKKFSGSPLSQLSQKDLKEAKTILGRLGTPQSKIFIFAFGGMGSSSKIARALFPSKNKNVFLVDEILPEFLILMSRLKKQDLKSSHFLFISKSGQTKELIFYKSLLKKIFVQKKLSLSGRITLLSQNPSSPLLKWIKKEGGQALLFNSSLPGRFSFFNLSGLLQFELYGLNFSKKASSSPKVLEFFIHHSLRKEFFLCPFHPRLKELALWMERTWSESLFKEKTKGQAPRLRYISPSDLRHAFIEELIAKKNQACFWALDISGDSFYPPINSLYSSTHSFYPPIASFSLPTNSFYFKQLFPENSCFRKNLSPRRLRHSRLERESSTPPAQKKHSSSFNFEKPIKELIKIKKIPYLFMKAPLNEKALAGIIFDFYKIIFCMGELFKVDIFSQPWVDYLKKPPRKI